MCNTIHQAGKILKGIELIDDLGQGIYFLSYGVRVLVDFYWLNAFKLITNNIFRSPGLSISLRRRE
jgi:hypothetical protein